MYCGQAEKALHMLMLDVCFLPADASLATNVHKRNALFLNLKEIKCLFSLLRKFI